MCTLKELNNACISVVMRGMRYSVKESTVVALLEVKSSDKSFSNDLGEPALCVDTFQAFIIQLQCTSS